MHVQKFWPMGLILLIPLGCGREGQTLPEAENPTSGENPIGFSNESSPSKEEKAVATKGESSAAKEDKKEAPTAAKQSAKGESQAKTSATKKTEVKTEDMVVEKAASEARTLRLKGLPPTSAIQALKYEFQLEIEQASPKALTYRLLEGPEGMTLSPSGLISWIPGAKGFGTFTVTFSVTDASGASLKHSYRLTLSGTCKDGTVLGVWRGKEADDEHYLGEILAYEGDVDAAANYGYASASVHLKHGPAPKDNYGTVFFYRDSQGELNFFFFFSMDNAMEGANEVKWLIETKGNNLEDAILVYDDPNDPFSRNANLAADTALYKAHFQYNRNSDGGVIGPFRGEGFQIGVTMENMGFLSSAKFYSAAGYEFPLYEKGAKGDSFVIGFKEERLCEQE